VGVRLAPGTDPDRAIVELDQLLGNFAAANPPATANPRDAYVRWTTDAELRLRTILHQEDARAFFSRDRHRDVCTMPLGNQLRFLISAELDALRHDGLNRLTLEQFPNGTSNTYTYDAASNLTGIDDGHGKVTYGYDKANQLTSANDPGASNHTSLTYNNDGQLLTTTYPSGASMVNSYNSLDQLTKVSDNYKTSSGASAHLSYAYTYTGSLQNTMTDQAGNLTTYTYDALNRLTDAKTVNAGTTADYRYTLDGAGNVKQIAISGSSVTASTSTYAYYPGNEICWSFAFAATSACGSPPPGAHSYTYDGDGNQTSNGNGLTATYNALGQTTSITSGGTTTNYTYLGEGQTALSSEGATALQNDTLGPVAQTTGSGTTNYTQSLNGTQLDERTPTATYNYLYDGTGRRAHRQHRPSRQPIRLSTLRHQNHQHRHRSQPLRIPRRLSDHFRPIPLRRPLPKPHRRPLDPTGPPQQHQQLDPGRPLRLRWERSGQHHRSNGR
jgi:YD repeat-containing protein